MFDWFFMLRISKLWFFAETARQPWSFAKEVTDWSQDQRRTVRAIPTTTTHHHCLIKIQTYKLVQRREFYIIHHRCYKTWLYIAPPLRHFTLYWELQVTTVLHKYFPGLKCHASHILEDEETVSIKALVTHMQRLPSIAIFFLFSYGSPNFDLETVHNLLPTI